MRTLAASDRPGRPNRDIFDARFPLRVDLKARFSTSFGKGFNFEDRRKCKKLVFWTQNPYRPLGSGLEPPFVIQIGRFSKIIVFYGKSLHASFSDVSGPGVPLIPATICNFHVFLTLLLLFDSGFHFEPPSLLFVLRVRIRNLL